MGAMLRFKQETGKEITEIDPTSFTDLCTYLWCCIVSGAKHEGKHFDMSLMDFADALTPRKWPSGTRRSLSKLPLIPILTMKKKPVGIYELLGIALGCIGMSHDDFCTCTFVEFEAICAAWREMREAENHDAWERARIMSAIGIQPHIRKRITPQQLLPLPWDKKKEIRGNTPEKILSIEERMTRIKSLVDKLS